MPKPLPPPLPPAERTVGQLIAEAIRLYGRRFWPALALGLSVASVDELSVRHSLGTQTLILWACTPLLTASFVGAVLLTGNVRRDRIPLAFALGLLVFAPVPILLRFFVLPALAWLALFGLAVPAALHEGTGFRASLARGRRLAGADYVHSLGSLCALGIVYFVTRITLGALLHGQADTTERVAGFLADLVISPLVFLGSALLYFDQAARVVDSRHPKRRRRDADLPAAVDADRAGRSNAEVQP